MRRTRLFSFLPTILLRCQTVIVTPPDLPTVAAPASIPAEVPGFSGEVSPAAMAHVPDVTTGASTSCSEAAAPPVTRLDPPDGGADEEELPLPVKGQVITGKCTCWHTSKGFGFITGDYDQRQYFVHFQQLFVKPGGYHSLINGQDVSFTVDVVPHGVTKLPQLKALRVTAPDGRALPPGPKPEAKPGGLVSTAPTFVKQHMEREGVKEVTDEGGKRSLFFVNQMQDGDAGQRRRSEGHPFTPRPQRNFSQRDFSQRDFSHSRGRGRGRGFQRGGYAGAGGGARFSRGGDNGGARTRRGGGGGYSNEGGGGGAGMSFASAVSAPPPDSAKEDNSFLGDVPSLEGFDDDSSGSRASKARGDGDGGGRGFGRPPPRARGEFQGRGDRRGGAGMRDGASGRGGGYYPQAREPGSGGGYRRGRASEEGSGSGAGASDFNFSNVERSTSAASSATTARFKSTSSPAPTAAAPPAQPSPPDQFDEL